MSKDYQEFLENKIVAAGSYGFQMKDVNGNLLPHAKAIVDWCIKGGRRAIFASFGLTKTAMQLEIAHQVILKTGKPFLICCPLGVVGEFRKDNKEHFKEKFEIEYITDSDNVGLVENKIYITNYERVRKGDVKASDFGGVSFDEASILRNLKTETTNFVLKNFKEIEYRFVATATPTPNDFIEILNYADFLGVIDRGHALTRFSQRDSTKAGHLTLYENKKEEFWKWVSTWACFINKPSDLGFDDTGYDLPKMNLYEIEIDNTPKGVVTNKDGHIVLFKDTTKSLVDTSREKSQSIEQRVDEAFRIVSENPNVKFILWHHLESERYALEKKFKDYNTVSVFGSQTNIEKETKLRDFSEGKYDILITKPKIAGSGCNFQHVCRNMIYVGIDYKFNDFIQGIHRIFRFRQLFECNVWMLFTNNEREVLKTLKEKWKKHIELQSEMINLVREYGLNTDKITADMKRKIFEKTRSATIGDAKLFNDDTVNVHKNMKDNSTDMILTSIPFGDHYEYSDNYNDFGHNDGNEEFFKQMDFLTPNLLRTLKPGKIAAIHVKDRIRYSYQNGTSFTSIDSFSNDTLRHFTKASIKDKIEMLESLKNEGVKLTKNLISELEELKKDYENRFYHIGTITVTTDVVRENKQTYRLGWSEQCKDATKMGVGLPEYIYLFRKKPTESNNAYADEPCEKTKQEYPIDNWQLDAHAFWKSSGDRFMSSQELSIADMKAVFNRWRKFDKEHIYNFQNHLQICKDLEESNRLSRLFMTIPPTSNSENVWSDVNRMNTLNANQANRKKEKHICPLQLDIIERLINRFTMKGDVVDDPFGGLFSTAYKALEMGRKAISAELNPEYYDDGLFYCKSIEYKINVPTLFDTFENVE